ncbi:MAG: glycosyltransferase family 2 protein [Bacteroidetes bacterium]|uniref:Glycosyltransferase family 2 protein n=1 Tax=Candidatus Gallipaludibacter merdavium TaxID=2840839 RepID=A0A9D9HUF0_9BACT|nr:glycosyltransferase family 2 protein [Candidatus Gallipaludibacter merdavium]
MISVLICTYNRGAVLKDCLDSLLCQTTDMSQFEVLVVNNNSSDITEELVLQYVDQYDNFRLVSEPVQGLSNARNRAYKEAKYDWLLYLDDDAIAYPDMIQQAIYTIDNFDFDMFGGMYFPWYRDSIKPRWMSNTFGQSIKFLDNIGYLKDGEYVSGGIMVMSRRALQMVDGFPTTIGMNGSKIAYGEETYIQNKLRELGYKIGYNPNMCITHLVPTYKQTVSWQLRAAYAHGRDSVIIYDMQIFPQWYILVYKLLKIQLKSILLVLRNLFKRKKYYWQNIVLDMFSSTFKYCGYIEGIINKKKVDA